MKTVQIYYSDSRACVDMTKPENFHTKFEPGFYWELYIPSWEMEEVQGLIRARGYEWRIRHMNGPFSTKNHAWQDMSFKFNLLGLLPPSIVENDPGISP